MTHLIVGGTSGLGLELARRFSEDGSPVIVAGRRDPGCLQAVSLNIDATFKFIDDLDYIVKTHSPFQTIVYNSGFYQNGFIDDLSDDDIIKMDHVGLTACALLMRRVMSNQTHLPLFIVVTSSSQYTPRLLEPMYTAVKAGLAMFAHSLSKDVVRIVKTLVVAPAGMQTPFWDGTGMDTTTMLQPVWVADRIMELTLDDYGYRYAQIHRNPPRVKVIETE